MVRLRQGKRIFCKTGCSEQEPLPPPPAAGDRREQQQDARWFSSA